MEDDNDGRPATEKQMRYIRFLLENKELTTKRASFIIDVLQSLPEVAYEKSGNGSMPSN